MKLDKFFQLFVVKERKFYPLFIRQSENIIEAATVLQALVKESSPEKRKSLCEQIKKYEKDGDTVVSTIYKELYRSFVTPFDREDINNLAFTTDSFLDLMYDAAKKISIYNPKKNDPIWAQIADNIHRDAVLIKEIMENLEKMRSKHDTIYKHCSEIGEIEHTVDDLYEDSISKLYSSEQDAIELMKYINIVQSLEDTTDLAKKVSNIIRTILIKQA